MELERIKINGIQKDVSSRAIDNSGSRLVLNPLVDAQNCRIHTSENGDFESVQNIPGTIGYDIPVPSGTNLVIGQFTDRENYRLIIFNWNQFGNHGIYSFNPENNTFTTHIVNSLLNFSNNPRYRITGVGMSQNLLYWTDGLNPLRMINLTRNYSSITDDVCINLYKRPPVYAPKIQLSKFNSTSGVLLPDYYLINNPSYKTSAIAGNIYQFATRHVFFDNEISAFSQWSNVASADREDTLSSFVYNGFQFEIYFQTELSPIVKKIQILYRKNNGANWYIYSEKKPSDFTGNSLVVQFFDDNSNYVIPDEEATKFYDAVPIASKNLCLFKNRVFTTADLEGYNITPIQNVEWRQRALDTFYPLCLKDGGQYSYGLVYFDKDMRTPGVGDTKNVSIPKATPIDKGLNRNTCFTAYPFFNDNNYPLWAKYVSVCRSANQAYDSYMQIPVKIMFYVGEGDLKDALGNRIAFPKLGGIDYMEKYSNGKVYLNQLPGSTLGGHELKDVYSKIHLQTPDNIPFIPDTDCFVRVITQGLSFIKNEEYKVLGFDGQVIIIDNINREPGKSWANTLLGVLNASLFNFVIVEVFKPKKEVIKTFYELGRFTMEAISTSISTTFNDYDTFIQESSNQYATYKFKNLKSSGVLSDNCYNINKNATYLTSFASPSFVYNKPNTGSNESNTYNIVENAESPNTPDYSKAPFDTWTGRQVAYNPNAVQLNRNTTIRYSDSFIQDSLVNGLSSFNALNEYVLPTFRTPIMKLQPAGNVLLAIHQRTTTSLYVNQNIIQDSEGKEQITKTTAVIGTDRELEDQFGTYHPESVCEFDSKVFAFDIFKGVVWQYDNNGQVAISDRGMQTYFKQKADQYLPRKDSVAIVGGIDPYNKEYIITFPSVPKIGALAAVTGETWAYNFVKNEWCPKLSFTPNLYANINNYLISFVNNKLWVHNQDTENCNTFYGIKYPRSLTFEVNCAPSQVKNFAAVQISAEELCEGDRYTTKTSYADTSAFPGTGNRNTLYIANDTGKSYFWDNTAYIDIKEYIILTATNREGQSTYVKRKEFDKLENIFYAPILKDTNTNPALIPAGRIALRDGKDMVSQVLRVTINNNSYSLAKHHYSNILYVHSKFSA